MENNGIGVGINVDCGEELCEESKRIVQECAKRIAEAQVRHHLEQERKEQERLDRIQQIRMEQKQAKYIAQHKDSMKRAIVMTAACARECGHPFDGEGLLKALEDGGDLTKIVRFFGLA